MNKRDANAFKREGTKNKKMGANWEELDCSKKLLVLLKQGYTLQYAGKGAFIAIKGEKRFFIREDLNKKEPREKGTIISKEEA